jgi:hypothetical protein
MLYKSQVPAPPFVVALTVRPARALVPSAQRRHRARACWVYAMEPSEAGANWPRRVHSPRSGFFSARDELAWNKRLSARYDGTRLWIALLTIMTPEEYRRLAEECERAAAQTSDRLAECTYKSLAERWRKLADDVERYGLARAIVAG